MEENRIIRDMRVLTEEFIPSRIIHRDSQLGTLKANLEPLIEGEKARHSFLFGPPGTGKTSISLHVSEELKRQAPINFSYINCWESSTRYSILYSILKGLGIFVQRKGVPTDEMLGLYRKKTSSRPSLVVLDEADRLEEEGVLYDLILAGAGLVLISNSETALYRADPRVRSRLSSIENVQFHKYTEREISDILKDRREWGLVPGTLGNSQIERISSMSGGDARIALSILSIASRKAEDKDLERIPDRLIEEAVPNAVMDSRRRTFEGLNPYQKAAMELLRSGEMKARDLLEALEQKMGEKIIDRTFRKYMGRLVRHGLVSSRGEGRWRVYSAK